MQFLRTLLLVFTAGIAVAFAIHNWTSVPIALWGGLVADVNLPLLMAVCFAAGLIPTWLWHQAVRWRLRQRLQASERTIEAVRASTLAPPPPAAPLAVEAAPAPPASAAPLVGSQA